MKRLIPCVFLLFTFASHSAFAQLGKKGVEARNEKATQPQNVKGGATFQVSKSYKETYDALINWVKGADYGIDGPNTSESTGQIVTAMAVDEKDRGSATRLALTIIKKSEGEMTVKVVVYEQRRSTFAGTGSWGDAKLKEDTTKEVANKIETALVPQKVVPK